jgi:hypothetical protein
MTLAVQATTTAPHYAPALMARLAAGAEDCGRGKCVAGGDGAARRSGTGGRGRLLVAFLATWLAHTFAICCAAPIPGAEAEVKARLLFHLAHFVTWPTNAWTNDAAPLVIGILGPDPFEGTLDAIAKEEKTDSRAILIRRANTLRELTNAHILYVSPKAREPLSKILESLKSRPTLTVGESKDFIGRGGMMRFQSGPDRKARLQVDLDRVRRQSLNVSAQLLRVCDVVGGGAQK